MIGISYSSNPATMPAIKNGGLYEAQDMAGLRGTYCCHERLHGGVSGRGRR